MGIYTKTGDKGMTGLWGGKRVAKDSLVMHAIGEIDELNAILGLCWFLNKDHLIVETLRELQGDLLRLGSDLATRGKEKCPVKRIGNADVKKLEKKIDALETEVKPLDKLILPGGTHGAGCLHYGRAVCRRAERAIVSLKKKQKIGEAILPFMNRMADLLFILARYSNEVSGVHEEQWPDKD